LVPHILSRCRKKGEEGKELCPSKGTLCRYRGKGRKGKRENGLTAWPPQKLDGFGGVKFVCIIQGLEEREKKGHPLNAKPIDSGGAQEKKGEGFSLNQHLYGGGKKGKGEKKPNARSRKTPD